ncbi:MAG: hypothetical protein IT382_00735 [Deltaproteobacteria bacterium]|nr:hypothetical protein [Deltaproteobacteria bacterium]
MTAALALCVGVALATPGADTGILEASESLPLVTSGTAAVSVEADALGGRIVLTGAAPKGRSTLCPSADKVGASTVLHCKSRRVRARVELAAGAGGKAPVLLLSQMRAAPVLDGDATLPLFSYATPELGMDPCDAPAAGPEGPSASVRGECALTAGRFDDAVSALAVALDSTLRPHAALRLGDAALLVDDVERAAAFWDSVGTAGPWTRLAAARLCDLLGTCRTPVRGGLRFNPLDSGGLPPVAQDEILLRQARTLAYDDQAVDAVSLLVEQGERACGRAPALCRRIALEALRSQDGPASASEEASNTRRETLALVLTIGLQDDVTSTELAGRLAEDLAVLGVPNLGADLLASASRTHPNHDAALLRAAELYADAGDGIRAATVTRYMVGRKPSKELAARWKELERRIDALNGPAHPPETP